MFSFISGCSFLPKQIETQKVKVPVYQKISEPPKLKMPVLPIDNLDEDASYSEIANAYAKSIKILKAEIKLRDDLLDSYRNLNENK